MDRYFQKWKRLLQRTPIALRLFVFVILPVVAVVILTGGYLLSELEQRFERRMEEDVEMVARSLQLPVSHALERKRLGSLGKSITSAIRIGRVYGVRLYDHRGKVIASTIGESDDTAPGKVVKLDDIDERHREYGEVGGEAVYSYFVPLFGSTTDHVIGFLQVTRRKQDFQQLMGDIQWTGVGIVALVVILLSTITLGGFHSAVGRAVGRLRETMRRIKQGDHQHRATPDGPRELAEVARSFNTMLDSLQEAERRVKDERRQKADLEDELRESEKMAAVGRVSAGVAHELGNPLNTISGHLQRLDRRHASDSRTGESVEAMNRETDRMENIIQQMLDFGRTSRADRSELTPSQLVEFSRKRLVNLANSRGATLQIEPPDSSSNPRVEVIPARLEQALVNLVENAARASSDGRVRLSWQAVGDRVEFYVDDDGPGVDREIRDNLFEPFVTTRSHAGGAGLGLAIVEAVTREHGGFADVETSSLGGARFVLAIPTIASTNDSDPDTSDHDRA